MNKKFKLNRIKSVLAKEIYNQFGVKLSINKKNYFYLCISVFFLFFVYLSIPSFYNFDKLKPNLEKEIYNQFGLTVKINKIDYFILPTPRIKLVNTEIYNFYEKKKILSSVNKIIIPINVLNIVGIKNIKFISFIINNLSIDFYTSDIINLKNFYYKIQNSKKIKIKNSKVSIKNNDNIISIIKVKNLVINPKNKDQVNKLIANTNIFNLDVNFIHEKKFNSNTQSNLQIFIPKLSSQIKTNIFDKNMKGSTTVIFPKSKIKFNHEFIDNIIKLTKSKVDLKYFNGDFIGTVNFDPFNFDFNFDLKNFYFSKLISSQLVELFKTNNILRINNKINGNVNFDIMNFKNKSNFISSGKINLEFRNGGINIKKFNLIIKDIGYIDINGYFVKQRKKNHFIFDTNVKIQNHKLLYSRLTIPKRKRVNKIDLYIKSIFDFNNNELIIKELKNVNNFSDDKFITDLNIQINNLIQNQSLQEIFNYFNFRLFVNNIIR